MTNEELNLVLYVFEYVLDEEFLSEETLEKVKAFMDKYNKAV